MLFKYLKNSFTKHPNQVGMTYKEHLKFSFNLSLLFLEGSYKALIHSIFPQFYITSSSDISNKIVNILHNRRNKK